MDGRDTPSTAYTYFTDVNLANRVPTMLRASGWETIQQASVFPADAPDAELLKYCGEHDLVFVTQDRKIRYHATELEALIRAGVRAVVVTAANLTADKTGEILVKARPAIERYFDKHEKPCICRVDKRGAVAAVTIPRPHRRGEAPGG